MAGGREFQKVMYRLLYSKWVTNKNLLYSTWKSTQCYVPAWIGRGYAGEWIHIYVWLSPFAIHLKLSQHCESVIQNKKFKKMNKQTKQTTKKTQSLGHIAPSSNPEKKYINTFLLFVFFWDYEKIKKLERCLIAIT